eukprot:10132973-Prorocentrum_lima.AAC.1
MTSSLVGSEMCIRDRMLDMKSMYKGSYWAGTIGHIKRAILEIDEEENAVSYTHLTLPTICSV